MTANAFQKWVKDFGEEKLAVAMGVSYHAVRSWYERKGSPKTVNLLKLIKLGKGKLSFEQIIKDTQRK